MKKTHISEKESCLLLVLYCEVLMSVNTIYLKQDMKITRDRQTFTSIYQSKRCLLFVHTMWFQQGHATILKQDIKITNAS